MFRHCLTFLGEVRDSAMVALGCEFGSALTAGGMRCSSRTSPSDHDARDAPRLASWQQAWHAVGEGRDSPYFTFVMWPLAEWNLSFRGRSRPQRPTRKPRKLSDHAPWSGRSRHACQSCSMDAPTASLAGAKKTGSAALAFPFSL